MPGQAGAFSALPQQQGRNPIEYTRSLKQIPPKDLIRLYNDPNDLRPKWAVASAYADAMKARALQRGVQGQQAMAQNAQQQQQMPVVDELMSIPLANGGHVKSYELGGDIESNDFDNVVAQIDPQFGGSVTSAEDDESRIEAQRRQQVRQQYQDMLRMESPVAAQRILDENPWLKQEVQQPAPAQPASPPTVRQTAPAGPAPDVVPSGSVENRLAGLPAARDVKRYDELLEADVGTLANLLRQRQEVPEEIKTGRQRVADLRAAQIQQAQEDARLIRETGVARLQQSLDKAKAPIINDPRALFAIAASINPEKGKLFSSLSSGIEAVLADRAARAEKAEQGIETLSEKVRLLNTQYREAQALEAQRQQALLEGDVQTARNAEIEAAKLRVDMRRTQASIQAARMEAAAKQEAAGASREASVATREANNLNRLNIALSNRQKAFQEAKEEWGKRPDIKMAAIMSNAPNAKPEDVKKWEDMQKAFETQFRNSQEIRAIDNAIAALSRAAGVAAPVSMGQWGNLQISEPAK